MLNTNSHRSKLMALDGVLPKATASEMHNFERAVPLPFSRNGPEEIVKLPAVPISGLVAAILDWSDCEFSTQPPGKGFMESSAYGVTRSRLLALLGG